MTSTTSQSTSPWSPLPLLLPRAHPSTPSCSHHIHNPRISVWDGSIPGLIQEQNCPFNMIAKYAPQPVIPPPIEASALPAASSPDLVLEPGTLEEYEQTWCLNSNEWRGPLDLSQYVEREHFLLEQDLSNRNQNTSWILTSSELPPTVDGSHQIIASCETFHKSAYVARDGKIDRVRVHSIGSVYTRPEYRGRGYAGRMMTELGKRLDSWQQHDGDKAAFSVLFSDIGPKFYSKFGWDAFQSTHIALEPLSFKEYRQERATYPEVEDLGPDSLYDIPATKYVEAKLKTLSLANPNTPCVAIQPDMQHFRWHHAREEFQTQFLDMPFPYVKGATHQKTGITMIWARVFASKPQEWSLHILHTAIPPRYQQSSSSEAKNAISALLLRAQHEAHLWRMVAGVEVWDPTELIVAAAQQLRTEDQGQVKIVTRDEEHICSLKWNAAVPNDDPNGRVIWSNMEKYTWC